MLTSQSTHFANLKEKLDSGALKMGGALLDEVPEDDDASKFKFNGSTLVCIAETKEEIVTMLKNDVYAESGVWDVENVCPPCSQTIEYMLTYFRLKCGP